VVAKDEPVRDRLFMPLKECTNCTDVHRCPECFGIQEGRQRDHCRICSCAGCCNESIKFKDDIRSGEISLSQVFRDRIKTKNLKPGPMAKALEQEFEDNIPF
jgi:hypothetical protein